MKVLFYRDVRSMNKYSIAVISGKVADSDEEEGDEKELD